MIALWLLCTALAAISGYLYAALTKERGSAREQAVELREASTKLAAHAGNYHQKLRALSESSGAGIIMLDDKGVVVHANATAERIFSVAPDGMTGRSLIQATLSSALQNFVVNAAKPGNPHTADFQLPGPYGRILRSSIYDFSVGLSGAPETMLVLVDVTELRRLETIRRDFVANVSHELRTPLASIRAMAETLQEGALQDEAVADRFLSSIVQESDRLARISADLLILSDAESKEPERARFDLAVVLRDVYGRYGPEAKMADLTFTLEAPEPMEVWASKDQIEQVVVNLFSNAIKYTPAGGTVTVRGRNEDDHLVVEVADTGIGIMHDDLPRIFERFYRVDKARSRASGGTGLGLSIVKNIVEGHGGEVRVASEFHRGSTFTVVLPSGREAA